MDITVHPAAAEAFNRRAHDLLAATSSPSATSTGIPLKLGLSTGSSAHLPIAAEVVNPRNLVRRGTNPLTGELVDVEFEAGGKRVVIGGNVVSQFTKLAFDVVSRHELRETCSQEFVERSLIDWLRAWLSSTSTSPWTDTLLASLAASVETYSFQVPLVGLATGTPFAVGPYRVSYITAADVEELASRAPEALRGTVRQREAKLYQGKCCVEGQATAEPTKAADLAVDAAENVVRALRFVHPAAFEIDTRCELGLLERVLAPGWHVFLRAGAERPYVLRGVDFSGDVPFAYSAADHEVLGQLGLNAASVFLERADHSPLREKAWSALAIFTRGLELGTWRDKVINALVAAETLLLRSETEPIQHSLGMRMARLVCGSLDHRKSLISELHFAYRARSAFIHHGRDTFAPEDRQKLTSVLVACRQVIHNCLQSDVETPEQLVSALDDANLR